jgi:hypothetical protein
MPAHRVEVEGKPLDMSAGIEARLNRKKIAPLIKDEASFQQFESMVAKKRKASITQRERGLKELRGPILKPIEDGPNIAELSVSELEMQNRWKKLDIITTESEETRLRSKEELWDQANEQFIKNRDRALKAERGEDKTIEIKESDAINHGRRDSILEEGMEDVVHCLASPAIPLCFVLIVLLGIMLIIQENSCHKRESSIFDGSCFGAKGADDSKEGG